MKRIHPLLPVIFSALLAGCASLSSPDTGCMKTVLVSKLSKAPLSPAINGDKRSLAIAEFKGGCHTASSGFLSKSNDIGITMTLSLPESRHKHGKVQKVRVPIFIALLDKEDNVLDRWDEKINLTIKDHSLTHTQKLTYQLPQGISRDSENHRILVGFNGPVKLLPSSPSHPSGVKKKKKK